MYTGPGTGPGSRCGVYSAADRGHRAVGIRFPVPVPLIPIRLRASTMSIPIILERS